MAKRFKDLIEKFVEAHRMRLLPNRVGDLALKIRIGVDDVPLLIHSRLPRLTPGAEQIRNADTQYLVGGQKEQARQNHHDEHHRGGNDSFPARRPYYLRCLRTNLLEEDKGVGFGGHSPAHESTARKLQGSRAVIGMRYIIPRTRILKPEIAQFADEMSAICPKLGIVACSGLLQRNELSRSGAKIRPNQGI